MTSAVYKQNEVMEHNKIARQEIIDALRKCDNRVPVSVLVEITGTDNPAMLRYNLSRLVDTEVVSAVQGAYNYYYYAINWAYEQNRIFHKLWRAAPCQKQLQ